MNAKRVRNVMPILGVCILISIFVTVYLWLTVLYNSFPHEEYKLHHPHQHAIVDYFTTNGLNRYKLAELRQQFPSHMSGGYDKYQLNITTSNAISVDREIPDTRPEACIDVHNVPHALPHVSVVIPFHDEVWSMLLRTLHSIYNRTPPELLDEIILVDDASSFPELHSTLENYIEALPKVRLIRNDAREGLIRSRVRGARIAKSAVIVFLDAHVEVGWNWLPPLLHALAKNHTNVAIPHIDWIKAGSLKYTAWDEDLHGGFSWAMDYVWKIPPKGVFRNMSAGGNLIPTPTTIGCAMAMYRDYFFRMGALDEGMRVWGGENIELSFRIWQCGGSMHIVPCSRVGHIFRAYLPYSFPASLGGGDIILKNYQRLVEVWLDDYKIYYYAVVKKVVPLTEEEAQSLEARKQLRDQLKCHSFKWFLENITPEMIPPHLNAIYFGQVKNLIGNVCVKSTNKTIFPLINCKLHTKMQQFSFTNTSHFVNSDGRCVSVTSSGVLQTEYCNVTDTTFTRSSSRRWTFVPAPITFIKRHAVDNHDFSKPVGMLQTSLPDIQNVCLSQVTFKDEQILWLERCDSSNPFHYWIFTYALNNTILNIMSKMNSKREL